MRNTYEYTAEVRLTRAQFAFLRDRYGKRDNVSAKTLVNLAVLETVAAQARKELDAAESEQRAAKRAELMEQVTTPTPGADITN